MGLPIVVGALGTFPQRLGKETKETGYLRNNEKIHTTVFLRTVIILSRVLEFWGFVLFYGISTIAGYFMSNPVFKYTSNLWFANLFCRYALLNDETVLFLTIQFSLSQQR